jgi:transcriptional regulator with XRE-family HTH domain
MTILHRSTIILTFLKNCQIVITMSHFAATLRRILSSQSQGDLARASGIEQATISRLLSGKRQPLPHYLEALSKGLSADDTWDITLAYISDICPDSIYKPLIEAIKSANLAAGIAEPPAKYNHCKSLSAALDKLGSVAMRNKDLQKVLLDLAKLF